MKTLKELLIELNACEDAIKWAGNKTIEQAVAECHRGDWMLWLAAQVNYDHRLLTLAKGHCANTVRHLMKDPRSIKAVDTAIAYGKGNATWQELKDAADLDAADLAAAASAASAAAAASAAYAAYADAAVDATVDFDADDIAAAADLAADAARKENRMQTADICRKYIGNDIIEKVNMLINKPVNN